MGAEKVTGQTARFGGGRSHHVPPSQGGRKVTFIHHHDSLAVQGAFLGCESAWDGPREPLLLLLPKSWLSGGSSSSLLQAGRGKVGEGGGVWGQSPRLLAMPPPGVLMDAPHLLSCRKPPRCSPAHRQKARGGQEEFPFPLPSLWLGFSRASRFLCIPSHRNFWAHRVISSGSRGGEGDVLA